MKKIFSIFLVVAIITTIFVSCTDEVTSDFSETGNKEIVELDVQVSNGNTKALELTNDLSIASYEYRAMCTVPNAQGNTVNGAATPGVEDGWTAVSLTNSKFSLELAAGTWTIEVRAKNADQNLSAEGTQNAILLSGSYEGEINKVTVTSGITITLKQYLSKQDKGTATVNLDLGVPTLESGKVEIRYALVGFSLPTEANKTISTGTADTTYNGTAKNGYTEYTDSTIQLEAGNYIVQILYKDGTENVAGQVIALRAAENTPITLQGEFKAGEFINFDVTVIANANIINVALKENLGTGTDLYALAPEVVATAPQTEGATSNALTNETYQWYVDGIAITDQTDAKWTGAFANGNHIVTCIVIGDIDGVQKCCGSISFEFTGESVVPTP